MAIPLLSLSCLVWACNGGGRRVRTCCSSSIPEEIVVTTKKKKKMKGSLRDDVELVNAETWEKDDQQQDWDEPSVKVVSMHASSNEESAISTEYIVMSS